MTPRLSVIIPTYRRRASVERALAALARQTWPSDDFEVIVSIDGAEDGTRELVTAFPAPYALHALWQPNAGRAAALNAGIRRATGTLLVFLDDDMEPAPGLLAGHWAAHSGGARLGVMGAVPIVPPPGAPPVVARHVAPKFNQHLAKLAQPGYVPALRDFYTGNFSIRRGVLQGLGLFDEAFTRYGNEDLELCLRLRRVGVSLVYCPDALARQHYTKDFATLVRDTLDKGQTSVLLASKHPASWPELRLSTYGAASLPWRGLRAGLLAITDLWSGLPAALVTLTRRLERWAPGLLPAWYRAVLDYFYWLGVRAALRQHRGAETGQAALVRGTRP